MSAFRVAMFSTKSYDQHSFDRHLPESIEVEYRNTKLTESTAQLAKGFDAICAFVNDDLSQAVLEVLKQIGIRFVVLRCAGFNNVDLTAAKALGIKVARVPAYSPEAVAEHTIALMLCLNRKLHKAYNRTKEDNFSLEGLLGFNIHGKTVGLIGTGNIGLATAKILTGIGAKVLAVDPIENDTAKTLGVEYVSLEMLFNDSDIISLHCPLNDETHHLLNRQTIGQMKPGVMVVNTSRGGLINSQCLIEYLKSGHIGHLALDVYEQESELFFEDRSNSIVQDDLFQRLLTFPNVLITGHQGFFTQEALEQIATTTIRNLICFYEGRECTNLVSI